MGRRAVASCRRPGRDPPSLPSTGASGPADSSAWARSRAARRIARTTGLRFRFAPDLVAGAAGGTPTVRCVRRSSVWYRATSCRSRSTSLTSAAAFDSPLACRPRGRTSQPNWTWSVARSSI